jgi:hypothetical protein
MAHAPPPSPEHSDIPVSSGMPPVVRLALVMGLVVILGIMGLTAYSSSIGHVWPWTDATKVKL